MVDKFDSPKEFVTAMMENEGSMFGDYYGREWKYQDYNFYFKDIGAGATHIKGLECLHLYGTNIKMIKTK
mgnify:CR=1 FL=1|tara:strand:- start:9738 stop:9947 length:210 start_codon:yes stop_codon:yes gene_type:complete